MGYILFSRAVQKEIHLEHIVEKIFPSLFRKKILFLFDFEKDFIWKKNAFHNLVILKDNTYRYCEILSKDFHSDFSDEKKEIVLQIRFS